MKETEDASRSLGATRWQTFTRVIMPTVLPALLTGFALAFSAGTFIFIALSDLLPEVQFHRHDRVPLFLTLVGGVLLMGFIAFLESLGEGKEKEESTKAVAAVSVARDQPRTSMVKPPGATK